MDSTNSETSSSPLSSPVSPERAKALLTFWFGEAPTQPTDTARKAWFEKNADFDLEMKTRFLDDHRRARAGELDSWKRTPQTAVALLLLLDQFPRNVFRGTPESFASDAQARKVASDVVASGMDQKVPELWRWFIYLPFEHSESLDDQKLSLRLFQSLEGHPPSKLGIDYAQKHFDVIQRFGRFPHRNAVLERESTASEEAFLKTPGSSF